MKIKHTRFLYVNMMYEHDMIYTTYKKKPKKKAQYIQKRNAFNVQTSQQKPQVTFPTYI